MRQFSFSVCPLFQIDLAFSLQLDNKKELSKELP